MKAVGLWKRTGQELALLNGTVHAMPSRDIEANGFQKLTDGIRHFSVPKEHSTLDRGSPQNNDRGGKVAHDKSEEHTKPMYNPSYKESDVEEKVQGIQSLTAGSPHGREFDLNHELPTKRKSQTSNWGRGKCQVLLTLKWKSVWG